MFIDHSSQPSQHNPLPVDAIARWLRLRGLRLPAWIIVESIRPFGWVLGQFCLVAHPLAWGLGLEKQLDVARWMLESPGALSALSSALAPDEEAF
jgi:hypothetical protein